MSSMSEKMEHQVLVRLSKEMNDVLEELSRANRRKKGEMARMLLEQVLLPRSLGGDTSAEAVFGLTAEDAAALRKIIANMEESNRKIVARLEMLERAAKKT